jgi:hypothetical protein
MPRGRPFEKGHKLAPGGPRPNSGRPPNEFRQWLGSVVHSDKARERLKKILEDGEDADEKVTDQGVQVPIRAKAQTYLAALELAWSYLESKAPTDINVTESQLDPVPTRALLDVIAALPGGTTGPDSGGTGQAS